jgi:hypothetical protein
MLVQLFMRHITQCLVGVVGLGALTIMLGCATDMDMNYISRDEIKNDPFYERYESHTRKPMSFGALRFKHKAPASLVPQSLVNDSAPALDAGAKKYSKAETEAEDSLFFLQRHQGVYYGETMVGGEDGKRYYFSLGVSAKDRAPMMGFRMEF